MGIQKLLERWGFVRLRDYGLLLTPDRRVLATRPILDDGFGGCVVGWAGHDLAMIELPARRVVPEAAPRAAAPRLAVAPGVRAAAAPSGHAAPARPAIPAIPPSPASPIVDRSAPEPPPPPLAAAATPPEPEPPEPEEDVWDWEIAMARARAAAEPTAPAPPPPSSIEPPRSQAPWLTAEPLDAPWSDDTAIRSVTRLARLTDQQLGAAPQPRTIIPVPALPVANGRCRVRPLDDVTRVAAPRRFPRSTNSQHAARDNDDTSTAVRPARAARW